MTNTSKAVLAAGAFAVAAVAIDALTDERAADPIATVAWTSKPARTTCDVVTVFDTRAGVYSSMQVCDDAAWLEEKSDGGINVGPRLARIPLDAGLIEMGPRIRSDGGTFQLEKAEHACACSSGANCEARLPDAGWARAPVVTLPAGGWRGAGCIRKACVELARGDVTSWPKECPGG